MAFRPYTAKPATDFFTAHETDINRRECRRTKPMRVLALGLGRTGTASLRLALQELGFDDCYHMMSASVENPPDCLMWLDALAAKYDNRGTFGKDQWDQLLGHCQAVCDWPAIAFAQELIEAYPDAKVIVTTRSVDSWFESTKQTVHWRATEWQLKWLAHFDWAASMYKPMISKFWDCFWEGSFEKNGKRRFVEHYALIRSLVPPERLLEYSVAEGWKPLCEFLEVPQPKRNFPKTNDANGFVARCQRRNRMQMLNVVIRFAIFFGVLVSVAAMTYGLAGSLWRVVHSGLLP